MSSKLPLVLWSGGADSTAIVLSLFAKKEPFNTCYFSIGNNHAQQKRELKARKKLKKILTKRFGLWLLEDNIYNSGESICPSSEIVLIQPFIWLTGLILNINAEDTSEIHMGYIKGDDFWHIRSEFIQAANNLFMITRTNQELILPTFKFMFEWHTKENIYTHYTHNRDIFNMTFTCESVTKKGNACGKCKKCIELKEVQQNMD